MMDFKGCKKLFNFLKVMNNPQKTLDWHYWLEHGCSHVWFCTLIYSFSSAKGSIHFCFLWWSDHYRQSIMDFDPSLCTKGWRHLLILLKLQQVLKGSSADNFTKVIVDSLLTYGGLSKSNLASKLVCFGANGVTTFQGSKTGVSM